MLLQGMTYCLVQVGIALNQRAFRRIYIHMFEGLYSNAYTSKRKSYAHLILSIHDIPYSAFLDDTILVGHGAFMVTDDVVTLRNVRNSS